MPPPPGGRLHRRGRRLNGKKKKESMSRIRRRPKLMGSIFRFLAPSLSRLDGVISHGRLGRRGHGRERRTNLLRDTMREFAQLAENYRKSHKTVSYRNRTAGVYRRCIRPALRRHFSRAYESVNDLIISTRNGTTFPLRIA